MNKNDRLEKVIYKAVEIRSFRTVKAALRARAQRQHQAAVPRSVKQDERIKFLIW